MIEEPRPGLAIVGTAHVSPQSVQEVRDLILARRPAKVLVELDAKRLAALQDPDAWLNTDIIQVIRQKKQYLFLLQLYLANMQSRLGVAAGAAPGSEMMAAVAAAKEVGAELVLIDRDIGITLRRMAGSMGFWARMRLVWRFMMEMFVPDDPKQKDLDAQLREILETKQDAITRMTDEFARFAPEAKTALIDERDDYMAGHMLEQAQGLTPATGDAAAPATGGIVAVIGAGHMTGIKQRIREGKARATRAELERPPPKRFPWVMLINLAITLLVAGALFYFIGRGDKAQAIHYIWLWVVLHFVFAGLGAALAFGHPLAILTGASAAPITSILPVGVKSGWLSGLVQASVRKPKVRDFQEIKRAERFGDFWRNDVVKVLTVTSLTIIGSEIANFVGAYIIARGLLR